MGKLIVTKKVFSKEEIKPGMFIQSKMVNNGATVNGVVKEVKDDKIVFLSAIGTLLTNIEDVIEGREQIKVTDSLNYDEIGKMIKEMDIVHDHYDGHSIEIVTTDSAEVYSKVVVNGRQYKVEPLIPQEVACNLGTLTLK